MQQRVATRPFWGRLGPERGARRWPGLEHLLRPFGHVLPEEATSTAILACTGFVLLAAYYLLKVVREPLIMMGGGAEVKRYAGAGQAVVLFFAVWGYEALASRYSRMTVISVVTIFFVLNLILFSLLGAAGVAIGIPFFVWVGVFSVAIIAQFWSLTNDLYTQEQGQRLFGVVGIGGSVGAVFGARLAGRLLPVLGPFLLLLVPAALLLLSLLLIWLVHRGERGPAGGERRGHAAAAPIGDRSTYQLFREDRFLLLLAGLTLVFNWVTTTGEYILDRRLLEEAAAAAAGQPEPHRVMQEFIGAFRAKFFGWVNLAALLLQAFVVSRAMAGLGVRATLLVTPLLTLASYLFMAFVPGLTVVAVGKAAESTLSYSLQNTARQALFLVTSREAKYKAKAAIDTVFWRAGDLMSAAVVWAGSACLLGQSDFVWLNLGLALLWLWVMVPISRTHRARSGAAG